MQFNFEGKHRLQGMFESPNEAGCVLVMGIVCVFCILSQLSSRSPRFWLCGTIALFLIYLLAITYSRGSYIALLFAIIPLLVLSKVRIWYAFLTTLGVGLVLIIQPASLKRVETITQYDDASISNRISLWAGTSEMTLQEGRYIGNVTNYFDAVYAPWYQDENNMYRYGGCVSSYFTILAHFGLAGLVGYVALASGTVIVAIGIAKNSSLGLCALAVQLAFHVAGVFSTAFFWTAPTGLFIASCVVTVLSARARGNRQLYARILPSCVVMCCVASIAAVVLIARFHGRKWSYSQTVETLGSIQTRHLIPNGKPTRNVIALLSFADSRVAARSLLRGLAEDGCSVCVLSIPNEGSFEAVDKNLTTAIANAFRDSNTVSLLVWGQAVDLLAPLARRCSSELPSFWALVNMVTLIDPPYAGRNFSRDAHLIGKPVSALFVKGLKVRANDSDFAKEARTDFDPDRLVQEALAELNSR